MSASQSSAILGRSPNCRWNSSPYLVTWIVIALVIAADLAGLYWLDCSVVPGRASRDLSGFLAIVLVIVWVNVRTRSVRDRETRWARRQLDLANTARWMIALAAFCMAASILSHLSVAAAYPLIDPQLTRIDEAIGFDWVAWYHWVRQHPTLFFTLNLAYGSGLAQTIAVPLVLGLSGARLELANHVMRFMLATLICLVVATLLPAASAFLHFHIADPGTSSTVSTFFPIRNGTLRVFDLGDQQGLVSMPSMHTAMAILFAYALRRVPVVAYVAAILNAVMIASTPTHGGHYLIDVVAGVLLAVTTIMLVKRLRIHDSSVDALKES
ncbi:phosphatase PAP2 family protein [Paraburkholderia aromaticivorans]|uniref:phosphatase PAP2 family protein n=1 Tax=Paraburkholderia aromaticivorans TaxID=2026199 RepID=UPI001455EADF|nr:phosphatase PAP2 family protein [Paraburkholderia aromaticivorans]